MSAQIVLLRQLMVVFYGNEVSLGLTLGAWLFWGAMGSWLLGRFADKIINRQFIFAALQVALAFILVGAIFIIRHARTILDVMPGEIIGFVPMAAFSFFTLSAVCIILGFLFALACRLYPALPKTRSCARDKGEGNEKKGGVYPASDNETGATRIGRVYILEALGAVCGGCLVSFYFIRYFDGFYIMLGLALLNLFSAYLLQTGFNQLKLIRMVRTFTLALIIIIFISLFTQEAKLINQASIKKQWSPIAVLAARDSIYNNLIVSKDEEQYSFFSNGLHMFSLPDEAGSEEAVHFALLQTPSPKHVLLIGGGIGGLSEEIFKYPLSRLDYLELDAEIIELAKEFLPPEKLKFLEDRRLEVLHQDGRLFIKRITKKETPVLYDNIILYLGDPYNAQINRFYTLEFFQEVKRCLKRDGVLSFGLGSSENFLNKEQQQFLSSIYRTLTMAFADVKVIPGDTAYFLAGAKEGLITRDYKELSRRLREGGIRTKFVRPEYLFSKLSSERIAYLDGMIKAEEKARPNRDFRPISYYYDMVLWSTRFARPWRKIFSWLNERRLLVLFFLSYLWILLSAFMRRKKRGAREKFVLLAVSTTGLTELSFQVVILLAFQIIYGYLYYKLGIILSFFMVGLVLGSWLITKRLKALKEGYGLFIKTQIAISLYPIILPLVFYGLNRSAAGSFSNWMGSNVIFPALPVISGFIGGFQFPLANKIILKDTNNIGRISGLSYGMDLLGACFGALLVSAFLVPILGITKTCIIVALLNATILICLLRFYRESE